MKNKVIKFSVISVSLILVVLLPFLISQNKNDLEPVPINDESIGYYQTNTCKISLLDVVITNSNKNIEYKLNNYSGIDCYGIDR